MMMKAMLGEHFCTNLVLYNTMACMHHLLEIISSMCFLCVAESLFFYSYLVAWGTEERD